MENSAVKGYLLLINLSTPPKVLVSSREVDLN